MHYRKHFFFVVTEYVDTEKKSHKLQFKKIQNILQHFLNLNLLFLRLVIKQNLNFNS